MKDHLQVTRTVSPPYGESLTEFIDGLNHLAEGLLDIYVDTEQPYYDESRELVIKGWRPMTEKELASAERRRIRAKKAAAVKKERLLLKDEREFKRLEKKLGR